MNEQIDLSEQNTISRIEVLVERDPDRADVITLYIDGVPTDDFVQHVVDPGAGWPRAHWDDLTAEVAADTTLSPAYRDAVVTARGDAADSEYIWED